MTFNLRDRRCDNDYDAEDYDCEDFAGDLEEYLPGKGYDATITCYWKRNLNWAWYNALWTDKWIDGHCLTDIYLADGSYVWIEPQLNSKQGAVNRDLDFDGDGCVGVAHENGSSTTAGDYRIEVYGQPSGCRTGRCRPRLTVTSLLPLPPSSQHLGNEKYQDRDVSPARPGSSPLTTAPMKIAAARPG